MEKTNPTTVDNKNVEKFAKSTNESPGVYGEIAYYWRATEDEELNNQDDNVELLELDDDAVIIFEMLFFNTFVFLRVSF